MNKFTIKDLENLSGIKAHTIRIWEQRYNFLKPQRTNTNIRYYSNEELKTVLNIALLNKYGFKISHIDRMQPGEIKERILSLGDTMAVQERVINELVLEMVDLDMAKFEKIISNYISSKGIERTVMQIIFPFLEKIGILWQTGNINPAQEHLVTNIIRQKLIAGIESTVAPVRLDKTFLLFLPEGEHHELGLLFMYYLLKSRGANTIYIGANVPVKDVEYIIRVKKPDIAFTHLTTAGPGFNFEKFLTAIQKGFGDVSTIISGQLASRYKKKTPANVQVKRSLPEVMEYLSSL
ncbi:MAG: MerR family transcriptional regulator [Ferruginibacter sp.]|nr:MerR family transcriptional regulator [Chitinophagaceae bacterium]